MVVIFDFVVLHSDYYLLKWIPGGSEKKTGQTVIVRERADYEKIRRD